MREQGGKLYGGCDNEFRDNICNGLKKGKSCVGLPTDKSCSNKNTNNTPN